MYRVVEVIVREEVEYQFICPVLKAEILIPFIRMEFQQETLYWEQALL